MEFYLLNHQIDRFVDFDTGKADFSGQEFIELLLIAEEFTAEGLMHPGIKDFEGDMYEEAVKNGSIHAGVGTDFVDGRRMGGRICFETRTVRL